MNLMLLIVLSMLTGFSMAYNELNDTLNTAQIQETKVLSRKKRFLVFPDGSSFQLVFCAQNMGYLQIRNVVWFGNTAALAWELPTDPNIFYFLKQEEKRYGPGLRRQDNKHIVYLDEDGKVISTVPYRKRPIVNPAFAKRSIESEEERREIKKLSIKEMHAIHSRKNLIDGLDKHSIEFHREGRKSLYEKLGKFLEGLGWRGKECILRFICETSRAEKKQGTLLEEIMRVTFMFPKSEFDRGRHKEYDTASTASGNCVELYPDCENKQGISYKAI